MDFWSAFPKDVSVQTVVAAMTAILLIYYWHYRPKGFPPGPRGIPVFGAAPFAGKFFERSMKTWSSTYGPVMSVRLGRVEFVILNDFESIHKALVKRKDVFSGRAQYDDQDMFQDNGYGIISVDYGPFFKSQRKFGLTTLRGFGVGKRSMEERVAEEVGFLNKKILQFKGKPFDILVPLGTAVSNNICSILFGNRFDYDDPRFSSVVHQLSKAFGDPDVASLLQVILLLPILVHIPPFSTKMKLIRSNFGRTERFVQEIINEHKETLDLDNPRDFIDAFFVEMNKGDDSSFTVAEIIDVENTRESLNTFGAKLHQTTYYSSKRGSPTCSSESVVTMSDRSKMPYTCAFIEELYRFRTLVPVSLNHRTTEDVYFEGYFIPKHTIVFPNLWAVHNDPQLWKNPEKFIPERHLDINGNFVKSNYVIPFSLGPRHCLGEQLARMEVFIFLVSLLQKFEFLPSPNDDKLPEIDDGNNAGVFIPYNFDVLAKEI